MTGRIDASENIGSNSSSAPSLGDIVNRRYGRRDVLRGALAVSAIGALAGALPAARAENGKSRFNFREVAHGVDERHHVAAGHRAEVLLRWGDPILPGAPAFDPMRQSAAAQAQQFGYNCDYVGYAPLPAGSGNPGHGLLCVNHEYTSPEVMFPGVKGRQQSKEVDFASMTRELTEIELAAHGCSVVEIRKGADGRWSWVRGSRYNRRITGDGTAIRISGPAAGHERLKTAADPTGANVIGTLNNCAGGMTPWGTYLTAEENFNGYFSGALPADHREAANHKRYGVPARWYNWGAFHDRFDVSKEPNEPNRFGWIVEIDPYDPDAVPVKRTALGRFKHEGAETLVNGDGRVVVYSGDDERFDYVYKFVTERRFDAADRAANRDLLDRGTLYVARFHADGTGRWLPLVHGQGPLTAANGFRDQGEVLIEARRAGDLLGATRMDRPEDVEANRRTGKVYVALTNNERRKETDPSNPRADNIWGHLIEFDHPAGDHAALAFRWNVLVRCGDPRKPEIGALWHPETSANGWFACPDNLAVDGQGRLWVGTDQGIAWAKASGTADGVWGLETEGPERGLGKMFFRVPVGAEICGCLFLPDDRSMTIAVQHPATDGAVDYAPFLRESTFEDPATRWPDFRPDMPPRPSVVMITREDGGIIGA